MEVTLAKGDVSLAMFAWPVCGGEQAGALCMQSLVFLLLHVASACDLSPCFLPLIGLSLVFAHPFQHSYLYIFLALFIDPFRLLRDFSASFSSCHFSCRGVGPQNHLFSHSPLHFSPRLPLP